jgi:hypothetical protein
MNERKNVPYPIASLLRATTAVEVVEIVESGEQCPKSSELARDGHSPTYRSQSMDRRYRGSSLL